MKLGEVAERLNHHYYLQVTPQVRGAKLRKESAGHEWHCGQQNILMCMDVKLITINLKTTCQEL